ncbi:MAG: DUF3817 domain-containing protein [Bowdeniella nasicola]|nr:DUF3817 domain-containing protein [Bowdeniella nasicola]
MASLETQARKAFGHYRVMAFVTGTFLLLLTLEIVLKYGFQVNGVEVPGNIWTARPVLGTWIAIVHGWIYVVYLVTVFNLWSRMRWGFGRMAVLIIAGVIPVLSFIMEPKAKRWMDDDLPDLLARTVGNGVTDE